MDSSDPNTTQEPVGMVTPPESLVVAPRRVDRTLTVAATSAFLLTRPTAKDHVGDRIRAYELVRGNQAQSGDWARRGPAAPTR